MTRLWDFVFARLPALVLRALFEIRGAPEKGFVNPIGKSGTVVPRGSCPREGRASGLRVGFSSLVVDEIRHGGADDEAS